MPSPKGWLIFMTESHCCSCKWWPAEFCSAQPAWLYTAPSMGETSFQTGSSDFPVLYSRVHIIFFFFGPCHVPCGILVPPGIKLWPTAVKLPNPKPLDCQGIPQILFERQDSLLRRKVCKPQFYRGIKQILKYNYYHQEKNCIRKLINHSDDVLWTIFTSW